MEEGDPMALDVHAGFIQQLPRAGAAQSDCGKLKLRIQSSTTSRVKPLRLFSSISQLSVGEMFRSASLSIDLTIGEIFRPFSFSCC